VSDGGSDGRSDGRGKESAQQQTATEPATQWRAVITLALATLIVASELTMSAFGLPLIAQELGVSSQATAWVLLAYSLPLAAMAISAGRWVDRADIRWVFMLSLVGVGVTSVLTAVSPNFPMLLLSRLLQGLASALYLAVYFPTVTATVHVSERGRAMSYIAMIMMVGSIAMAPLGGYVATHLGWREVFLVKFPFLALVLWMGYYTIPGLSQNADGSRITWLQRLPFPDYSMLRETLLIGGCVVSALLALEQFENRPLLGAGLLVIATLFGWVWSRQSSARGVRSLLGRAEFGLPVLSLMLLASTMGLMVFSLPFFIADVMQRSPEVLGVAMMAFVITASTVSPLAGNISDRYGPQWISVFGAVVMLAGVVSMLSVTANAGVWALSWRMAWIGLGMSLFNAPNMAAILHAAPAGQTGTAGGISTVARTFGNAVGPAVAAVAWSLGGGGLAGFRAGVIVLAALTLCGVIALLLSGRKSSA
ncbi:MAG: MFS transporter, partial [Pseudohongiella sp.]